jgi:alanine racemase
MDMIMVDVTRIAGAAVGDEVVLIGRQGEEQITANDIAMDRHDRLRSPLHDRSAHSTALSLLLN